MKINSICNALKKCGNFVERSKSNINRSSDYFPLKSKISQGTKLELRNLTNKEVIKLNQRNIHFKPSNQAGIDETQLVALDTNNKELGNIVYHIEKGGSKSVYSYPKNYLN